MKCLLLCVAFFSQVALAGIYGQEAMDVTVSIAPQKFFVDQIGGPHVRVTVMVPAGGFPHTYEPRPRDMQAVSRSKVFFAIGVAYEKAWLPRFAEANPSMIICRTQDGISFLSMDTGHIHDISLEHDHSAERHHDDTSSGTIHSDHEADCNHAEGEPDPHVWLSPPLVKIQAGNILKALKQADPAHAGEFQNNHDLFIHEIDTLDAAIRGRLSKTTSREFIVLHPAWGYFAAAYGLKQTAVEVSGRNPGPKDLERIISQAKGKGIRVIFVQPQISQKSAEAIARAIGGEVTILDPLSEDWTYNMKQAADHISKSLDAKP